MPFRNPWALYLTGAIIGEALLGWVPAITAAIDAVALVGALTQFGLAQRSPLGIGDPAARLLPAIALLPLMRLLSLTMPVPALPPIAWIALAGAPLLFAVPVTARLLILSVRDLGLATPPRSAFTYAVVVLSFAMGLVIAQLAPAGTGIRFDSPAAAGLVALTAVSFGAIPEELVFRGIIQPLMTRHIGRIGIAVATLGFAATYLGTGSALVVVLMAVVGLAYGNDVARTGSLWGPLVGHSVLTATTFVAGPLLSQLRF